MPVDISGAGTITGLQSEGISSQPVFPGNVIQVVYGSTNTPVSNASTSYVDTGLVATITPKSSNSSILVLTDQHTEFRRDSNRQFGGLRVLRDSTVVYDPVSNSTGPYDLHFQADGSSAVRSITRISINFVDNPNSTSSVTYKVQGRPYYTDLNGVFKFNIEGDVNATSHITLMEIAG